MRIQWVLANDLELDPIIDVDRLHRAGSFWGSWRTWREYKTDNVVCHDLKKATELVKRDFQKSCNLYIPEQIYNNLERPKDVRIYGGDFKGHDVERQDELVAMNLAGSISDIVLLLGFDCAKHEPHPDKLEQARIDNYIGIFVQTIKNHSNTQWILVEHEEDLAPKFENLPNLGKDTLANIQGILSI